MTRRRAFSPPEHDLNDATGPLDGMRQELLALDAATLRVPKADLVAAARVIAGAIPAIEEHRAELVALVGREKVQPLDRLELVVRAALQAHARYRAELGAQALDPLVARARRQRRVLRAEVRLLVLRGALAADVDAELSGGQGHKNLAVDLLQLSLALRQGWDRIEGRTCVERSELDAADGDANELLTRTGIIAQQGAAADAADLRARAFALMASTYDEVRRLVAYLRWHEGDADLIAPSFLGRPRGKRRAKQPSEAEASAPLDPA